jgi:hypothetical protein
MRRRWPRQGAQHGTLLVGSSCTEAGSSLLAQGPSGVTSQMHHTIPFLTPWHTIKKWMYIPMQIMDNMFEIKCKEKHYLKIFDQSLKTLKCVFACIPLSASLNLCASPSPSASVSLSHSPSILLSLTQSVLLTLSLTAKFSPFKSHTLSFVCIRKLQPPHTSILNQSIFSIHFYSVTASYYFPLPVSLPRES